MMDLRVIGATNRPTSKIQTTPFAKPANVNIFIVQVGILIFIKGGKPSRPRAGISFTYNKSA